MGAVAPLVGKAGYDQGSTQSVLSGQQQGWGMRRHSEIEVVAAR